MIGAIASAFAAGLVGAIPILLIVWISRRVERRIGAAKERRDLARTQAALLEQREDERRLVESLSTRRKDETRP